MNQAWEPMLHQLSQSRGGRLLAFARTLAGPDLADDLVQEAVIATFSKPRSFASVGQAEQYVRRAIASKYVDSLRKTTPERSAWSRADGHRVSPDFADTVAAGSTVRDSLESLPPRVRACIVLRYLEDLTIRETAHVLGLSQGAVKRYVSDGLRILNARLGTVEELVEIEMVTVSMVKGGAE